MKPADIRDSTFGVTYQEWPGKTPRRQVMDLKLAASQMSRLAFRHCGALQARSSAT